MEISGFEGMDVYHGYKLVQTEGHEALIYHRYKLVWQSKYRIVEVLSYLVLLLRDWDTCLKVSSYICRCSAGL